MDRIKEIAALLDEHEELKSLNASLRGAAQGLGELCDRYKAENAKLREQGARLFDKTLELATENAKLRELVETMHGDMREMLDTIDKDSDTWGYCRYYGECLDAAERIMRELGIEA